MKMLHNPKRSARLAVVVFTVVAVIGGALASPASASHNDEPISIVLKIRDGADIADVVADNQLRLVDDLIPSRGLYLVESAPGEEKPKKAKDLAKDDDDIVWAEEDKETDRLDDDRFHAWPDGLPTDVGSDASMWTNQDNLRFLRLDEVHQRTTGRGVTVAILDTGVDLDHPWLRDHLAVGGYDYVDDDAFPYDEGNGLDDDDDGTIDESYGHGTHTAGLVALVAPDAEILVYRVLDADGQGNPYVVAQAMEDAIAAGADVINVSFGMAGKPKSKIVKEAFKAAKKAGVAVVAAVGNDDRSTKQFPAEEGDVIGVAAMGNGNNDLARFSNYGSPALVAAPGEDIVSTLPGGGFGSWSGTSMASPIVAGQVALVQSADPDREIKKVIEAVGKSAKKFKSKKKVEKGLIDILESLER